GGVNVLFGHRNGLRAAGDQYWPPAYLDDAGVISDSVAWALAIADFDGDGYGDLAVGCPGSDVSGHFGAGAVVVLPGGPDGPSADGRQWLHEDLPPFDAATRDLEWFGAALTTGDWNGDGFADIAIGVPNEDSVDTQSGLVFAVYGDGQGLAAGSAEIWYQNSPGVANSGEFFDHLGSELTAGDYDGDGFDDLVLGVPEEDVAGRENAGVLHVIYGSAGGLGAGFQYWHQDRAGIRNRIDALDWFAGAVR
ncbi:MAG: FG-GAP repeat protein, partial [Planctomycetota bacterium]